MNMNYKPFIEEKTKRINKKLNFQRWFYSILGIITISIIVLLTIEQIRDMKKESNELAICLLLIAHSVAVLVSMLSTAIFCRITNAVLTTLTIILLCACTGAHFYIRFSLYRNQPKEDLHLVAVRLGFVFILLILLLPWTIIMVHEYQKNILSDKRMLNPKSTAFSWFLYLDFLLISSLIILNIRNQSSFGLYHILFLSIGILLALLWLYMGIRMTDKKTRHGVFSTIFYILSLLHIIYLGHNIYGAVTEYNMLLKTNESTLFSLLIIIFLYNGTNVLIHILTILISFILIDI
ncbi:unnamed protein product [Rotaria socialis]|uniref:Uncharacterized protein n=1 Tax=Rotaria socialis TaxID=392032 RepID=A0A820X463_9BILA|nr:unnamed protein product [Rotaria socialis]CAF3308476.1 unnamed protein product [Rotaria socialis]CAF3582147.1 unnamed protein product [Rotaria socialis]CAF3739113.1 unnamed protein product [Rotaria socialis]CAF4131487.1 unnamed protein product [Rotaria socialis]